MIIKNFTPRLKRNCLKLITFSSLLLIASCTQEETLSDLDLESTNDSNWSQNSVEIPVVSITAETEQSNNPASNAIDNDPTSRWSGNGNPVNLDLDLGSVNSLDYLNIAFHNGDERTSSFDVYISTDNNNWTKTDSKTSNGNTEGLQLFDLKNNDTRYIRLVCFGNSNAGSNWNSILDIEVMGTKGSDEPVVIPPTTDNLAYNKTATQSSNYSSTLGLAKLAVDGNTNGVWNQGSVTHTQNSSQPWWKVDLGSNKNIGNVKVFNRTNCCTSRLSNFNVDVLNSSGSVVSTIYVAETPSPSVTVSFDGATGRSIRVRLNGTNPLSLAEVEVYEYDGTVDPPTVDPPTGGSATDILGDFWKITLPIDDSGNGSGLNVTEYDDRNNDAAEYYDLDDVVNNSTSNPKNTSDYLYVDNGWAVFTAFCGGATTQSSQYPRSELRGLDSDGDDSYFDMDDYQELQVTVKVLDVPEQRQEVNMVQIHGPGDEPLRIEYNDETNEGLHVTYNDDDQWDDVIDYSIGDELKVLVKVDNGTVSFWLNNLSNGDSYNNSFSASDNTGYWKVGCYLQGSITYCDVKGSSNSECNDSGEGSDEYYTTGSVAVKDLTLVRDGVRLK